MTESDGGVINRIEDYNRDITAGATSQIRDSLAVLICSQDTSDSVGSGVTLRERVVVKSEVLALLCMCTVIRRIKSENGISTLAHPG